MPRETLSCLCGPGSCQQDVHISQRMGPLSEHCCPSVTQQSFKTPYTVLGASQGMPFAEDTYRGPGRLSMTGTGLRLGSVAIGTLHALSELQGDPRVRVALTTRCGDSCLRQCTCRAARRVQVPAGMCWSTLAAALSRLTGFCSSGQSLASPLPSPCLEPSPRSEAPHVTLITSAGVDFGGQSAADRLVK